MVETATGGGVTTTYRYDGTQQRIARISPTQAEWFVRDANGAVLTEFVQPNGQSVQWRRDYVYLGTRIVAVLSPPPPSPPTVTAHPSSQTVEAGQAVSFSAAASGYPAPTVQWQVSNDGVAWSDVVGATAIPYSVTTSASDNGKRFRAVFTNASGSATTNAAVLTVTCTATLTPTGGYLPSTVGATGSVSLTLPLSCPWTATSSQNWLALIGATSGTGSASITYGTNAPNLLSRIRPATVSVAGTSQTVAQRPGPYQYAIVQLHKGDYDGDGKTDVAVYRNVTAPANEAGRWLIRLASGASMDVQWGSPALGDIPVPADYDGDGTTDIAVYRNTASPTSEAGRWLIRKSSGGTISLQWGSPALGDIPVPAKYDGDEFADVAVYRRTTAEWFIAKSSGGAQITVWGQANPNDPYVMGYNGDMPVPADYVGDTKADIAVYRDDPESTTGGYWFVEGPGPGISLGDPKYDDVPVHAKYLADPNAKTSFAVYRPSTGEWRIAGQPIATWGAPSLDDIPVRGDYDGDGKADLAVYRNTSGQWIILRSTDGLLSLTWGAPALGDVPVR
jgi:hypothetical protein